MKVIFLDIDGVFNHHGSVLAFGTSTMFDDVSIRLVERLIENSGASVVVSSAWRIGRGVADLQQEFSKRGALILAAAIVARTDWGGPQRGDEIARWLDANPGTEYLIIDDDSDMRPEQKDRFVQTSVATGFRLPEFLAALRLFEPTHRDVLAFKEYRPRMVLEWP